MYSWPFTYEEYLGMDDEQLWHLEENDCPGVYRIWNNKGKLKYIGKSYCLNERLKNHERLNFGDTVEVMTGLSRSDVDLLEIYFINKLKPALNEDCNTKDPFTLDFTSLEASLPVWREFIRT